MQPPLWIGWPYNYYPLEIFWGALVKIILGNMSKIKCSKQEWMTLCDPCCFYLHHHSIPYYYFSSWKLYIQWLRPWALEVSHQKFTFQLHPLLIELCDLVKSQTALLCLTIAVSPQSAEDIFFILCDSWGLRPYTLLLKLKITGPNNLSHFCTAYQILTLAIVL